MKKLLLLLCGLMLSTTAFAGPAGRAPQKVTAVYEATRDGKPFAIVNETYQQTGDRYRIESVTTGQGVYALFGKRTMTSEGEVIAGGLKPRRFEQQQGDPKKTVSAEFDWDAGKLALVTRKKTTTVDLPPGTQDLASFTYQFMFVPPAGEEVVMPVTTGKRLRTYHYGVRTGEPLDILGGLQTLHLSNDAKGEGNDQKEFWLAVEKHHLPAKIVLRDENGSVIEQVLTSLSFE